MRIREHSQADIPEISRLFFNTARAINSRDYSPLQIEAWVPEVPPDSFWLQRFKNRRVFVAEERSEVIGFAEFLKNGQIDCFYVHHRRQRKGVGRALMERIEITANTLKVSRLFADVSITARPFFEKMGFSIINKQEKLYRGCTFQIYIAEKKLLFD